MTDRDQAAGRLRVGPAAAADAAALAEVAAATFPLACPPTVAAADIAAFIDANLTEARFGAFLADPDRLVLAAAESGRIVGYAVLVRAGRDADEVELSKIYLLPTHHRSGAAGELLAAGVDWAAGFGASAVWLGVNRHNVRAQRFYRKHGFEVTGTRTFPLGQSVQDDFVMRRAI